MAISVNVEFEVRTTGSDSNGGGFVTGASGTDRSQQDAAHAVLTTASNVHLTLGTNVIDVDEGDHDVTSADVGNILQITGGTATAGFYQITSVSTILNNWTLDRSAGSAGQTVVGRMGGALLSPGVAAAAITPAAGGVIWLRNGTYTISSTTANVANGRVVLPATAGTNKGWLIGYDTTRSNLTGAKPVLSVGAITAFDVVQMGTENVVRNIEVDGNDQTDVRGIDTEGSSGAIVMDCIVRDCPNNGILGSSTGVVLHCYVTGCNGTGGFGAIHSRAMYCVAEANDTHGITCFGFGVQAIGCISFGNTGYGFQGAQNGIIRGCTAYNNTLSGFDCFTGESGVISNCLAVNNAEYGFNDGGRTQFLLHCAGFNNTSGNVNSGYLAVNNVGFVTLTADPFDDAPNRDFAINNTAGGGAALRKMGFPDSFIGIPTDSFNNIGAAGYAAEVGALLTHPGMSGRING